MTDLFRRLCLFLATISLFYGYSLSAADAATTLNLNRTATTLVGPDSGTQLIVSDKSGKYETDVTGKTTFSATPPNIVKIDPLGYVTSAGNGTATITAKSESGAVVSCKVTVTNFETEQQVDFVNDMMPIFTKHGCNGGGCHGKSGGQNNFRLSLLGYEPWNDHDYMVRESRGRRLSPAAPEHSLVLMKATGEIPHEGGIRIAKGDFDYQMITRWIKQGMPYTPEEAPKVVRIEAFPKERIATPHARQQLAVTAYFSDGSARDITRLAIYEPNQEDMAEVNQQGTVDLKDKTGTTSVMVKFQEHVDVFRATIPLGAEMKNTPPAQNFIDDQIFKKLTLLGLPASGVCDDATFIRRVTVDIAGRLPTVEETKAFLASNEPDKRGKHIDTLLATPDYAAFFAGKWAGILRNKRSKATYQRGTYGFHEWIKTSMAENKPFDQFVSEIVSASGEIGSTPEVAWYRAVKDNKEQMQDVAQVFMGIRMQCAQCHHHPYEKWSQDDYYGFTAFFTAIGRKKGEQPDEEIIYHKRSTAQMQNPNTKTVLKPKPLGEDQLELPITSDPRIALADWMTSTENPYFAKMLVNRYWKHFFSRGLVEPEDDMRVTNPATHPELLDALAQNFTKEDFDLKKLIRTICTSSTYQLSAMPNDHNVTDSQNYSRYYPKRLQAEVLLDAINVVSNSSETFSNQPKGVRATYLPDDKFNGESYFLTVFGRPEMDSACECERVADANLAQSLHLINSDTIQKKLSDGNGRATALAKATDRPDGDRLSELYLYALARNPKPEEIAAAQSHLNKKRTRAAAKPDDDATPEKAEQEAFEDILWALVNTKEFLFNH